jgi:hypothetical protein
MKSRRAFLMSMTAGVVAVAVVVAPVIADELLGVISKVDIEGKKITVIEKDTDKEVVVSVADDAELVTPKGASKIDLEKLSKFVKKQQDNGKKGVTAKVTHKDKVASKIEVAKKKDAPKPEAAK